MIQLVLLNFIAQDISKIHLKDFQIFNSLSHACNFSAGGWGEARGSGVEGQAQPSSKFEMSPDYVRLYLKKLN